MTAARSRALFATGLALTAGFLWAAYYSFVYAATPTAGPAPVLALPFLVAGATYSLYALYRGHAAEYRRLFREAQSYLRVALLVGMQLSVLAVTYLAGAVDAALLSLVGDVVCVPLLLVALYGEGRAKLSSGIFLLGLALSCGGASLTIVGGGEAHPLTLAAALVAPVEPLTIGLYFILMARAQRTAPVDATVGQATLVAGLVALPLALLLPGGIGSLDVPLLPALPLLVALGLTSFFIAPALYFSSIARAGILLPSLLMSSIPVFTLALSALLFAVVPGPLGLLGVPVAIVGAVLALQGEHEPWRPEPAQVPP